MTSWKLKSTSGNLLGSWIHKFCLNQVQHHTVSSLYLFNELHHKPISWHLLSKFHYPLVWHQSWLLGNSVTVFLFLNLLLLRLNFEFCCKIFYSSYILQFMTIAKLIDEENRWTIHLTVGLGCKCWTVGEYSFKI